MRFGGQHVKSAYTGKTAAKLNTKLQTELIFIVWFKMTNGYKQFSTRPQSEKPNWICSISHLWRCGGFVTQCVCHIDCWKMRFLHLSWWLRCAFKVHSCGLLSAFGGRVRHLVGAAMCVYCASCLRLQLHYVDTQASFITRHVALSDGRDANGLLPTATVRVAAFYPSANIHTHARAPSTPLRKVHFCRTKWALNGLNRCVHTDPRPVGSLF